MSREGGSSGVKSPLLYSVCVCVLPEKRFCVYSRFLSKIPMMCVEIFFSSHAHTHAHTNCALSWVSGGTLTNVICRSSLLSVSPPDGWCTGTAPELDVDEGTDLVLRSSEEVTNSRCVTVPGQGRSGLVSVPTLRGQVKSVDTLESGRRPHPLL